MIFMEGQKSPFTKKHYWSQGSGTELRDLSLLITRLKVSMYLLPLVLLIAPPGQLDTVKWGDKHTPWAIKERGRKNYDGQIGLSWRKRPMTSAHVVIQKTRKTKNKERGSSDIKKEKLIQIYTLYKLYSFLVQIYMIAESWYHYSCCFKVSGLFYTHSFSWAGRWSEAETANLKKSELLFRKKTFVLSPFFRQTWCFYSCRHFKR